VTLLPWGIRLSHVGVALLAAAVFASALAVVYSEHESRRYFIELQRLQAKRDALNVEWGKLQLEQSTWATHGRIDNLARKKLDMFIPPPDSVVIVKP